MTTFGCLEFGVLHVYMRDHLWDCLENHILQCWSWFENFTVYHPAEWLLLRIYIKNGVPFTRKGYRNVYLLIYLFIHSPNFCTDRIPGWYLSFLHWYFPQMLLIVFNRIRFLHFLPKAQDPFVNRPNLDKRIPSDTLTSADVSAMHGLFVIVYGFSATIKR